ncbi:MAG: alpha-amylase [Bacteroidales bacterium]
MEDTGKKIIYQAFPRLWGNRNGLLVKNGSLKENGVGKFSSFTPRLLKQIREMGVTHIWYMGIIEHATQTDYSPYGIRKDHPAIVKGKAGSPYAIKDYYDVDPDLADSVPDRMNEFEQLVRRTHEAGVKVIIDFVPNHVARQYLSDAPLPYREDLGQRDNTSVAFAANNNFYYIPGHPLALEGNIKDNGMEYTEFPAKATGNNRFDAAPCRTDWYETVKLNYGVDYLNMKTTRFDPIPDTWIKMLAILRFWASKGIDGFRCDMAEMAPVEFWGWAIPRLKNDFEVMFIAEVYHPDEYRNYLYNGQFDCLYDKAGLYDTLRAVICGDAPASEITKTWQAVDGIQRRMLNFLENHDEQRIASDFFAGNARPGIPAMMVALMMNVNPVMIYNGQELGERGMDEEGFSGLDGRTTIFDYWSMESIRNWLNGQTTGEQLALRNLYAKLMNFALTEPAIAQGMFHDLMYANADNPFFDTARQYAFLRKHNDEVILTAVNFDKEERKTGVRIPAHAFSSMDFKDNQAAEYTDLLTGENGISALTTAFPYRLTIPPFSGKLIKFKYNV